MIAKSLKFKRLDFSNATAAAKRKRRPDSPSEVVDKQRMIQQFIRDRGITKLPPGWSHVDLPG